MRVVYFIIAWISLALGLIGIVLPVLPTTPFLLLTVVCFSKSSTRFEEWFQQTKLYQLYVADYRETKSIARSRKKKIIVYIYIYLYRHMLYLHKNRVHLSIFDKCTLVNCNYLRIISTNAASRVFNCPTSPFE